MIEINSYRKLSDIDQQIIEKLSKEAFQASPTTEKYDFEKPHWAVIKKINNEIVSFCNIVERVVKFDDNAIQVGGINNVVTAPSHQGKGYFKEVMKEAQTFFFNDLIADFGLLLCSDELVSLYKKLGWYQVHSRLVFSQPNEEDIEWPANVMLIARDTREMPLKINLQGLPW